jgi:cation transport protein ChaC
MPPAFDKANQAGGPAVQDHLWVFGYGSLIWDPGFAVAERQIARLDGYHRSFCMRSVHYRGTHDAPGLVLALDAAPGASCQGLALLAEPGSEAATLAALRERELISYAYREAVLPVTLPGGRIVAALTYVINRDHDQYCLGLTLAEQAQIIARSSGVRGPNRDYLLATYHHLTELGIDDPDMAWLAQRITEM